MLLVDWRVDKLGLKTGKLLDNELLWLLDMAYCFTGQIELSWFQAHEIWGFVINWRTFNRRFISSLDESRRFSGVLVNFCTPAPWIWGFVSALGLWCPDVFCVFSDRRCICFCNFVFWSCLDCAIIKAIFARGFAFFLRSNNGADSCLWRFKTSVYVIFTAVW